MGRAGQVYIGITLLVAAGQAWGWQGGLDPECVHFLAQRGLSPPAMDLDAVERTKRHYDAHAKAPAGSRMHAMRQRAQVACLARRAAVFCRRPLFAPVPIRPGRPLHALLRACGDSDRSTSRSYAG